MEINEYLNKIIEGDSIELIKNIPDNSIHLILSDIPYGIGFNDWDTLYENHNKAYHGTSPAQLKSKDVFGKRNKPINGWSESDKQIPYKYQQWCDKWASEWNRVLVPGGSAYVMAGRRHAHRMAASMQDGGFLVRDIIGWIKDRAVHRAQRVSKVFERRNDTHNAKEWEGWRLGNLKPIYEPIYWFMKPYAIGDTLTENALKYGVGPYNQAAYEYYNPSASNIINSSMSKDEKGFHETQKPIDLMSAFIELSSKEGHIVLDPFCGSGTTLVAAKKLNRNYIGFEIDPNYVNISNDRLNG